MFFFFWDVDGLVGVCLVGEKRGSLFACLMFYCVCTGVCGWRWVGVWVDVFAMVGVFLWGGCVGFYSRVRALMCMSSYLFVQLRACAMGLCLAFAFVRRCSVCVLVCMSIF